MIELVRLPDSLSIDPIAWSQTVDLAYVFAWKPSSTLSRLLAKGFKIGVEIEVGSEDAKALADVLQRAFSPQPMSHRQLARWGAIGLYAMDRIGKFDGSEQREIISFCKGGSFWLRCGYG
jgi:hypothetical protein